MRSHPRATGRMFPAFGAALIAAAFLGTPSGRFVPVAQAAERAVALPAPVVDETAAPGSASEEAVLAGGCFWGVQGVFQHVKGVTSAVSGYAGGEARTADYETVSTGTTGHAESVRITFDPHQISYGKVLQIFFSVATDPTELNRQGPDVGTQYRSEIFTANAEQAKIAQAYIDQLGAAKVFAAPIVTKVAPLKAFYPAEAYHQHYFQLHPNEPYIVYNDAPKVAHLKQLFPALYQPDRQVVEVQLH